MIIKDYLAGIKNKIRVRVCGILEEDGALLMIKHVGIGTEGVLWSPPGGGLEFGENAESRLIQEFAEETGLQIEVNDFLFVNEYVQPPLHAVELFFKVRRVGGDLILGMDPELSEENQIIQEIKFLTYSDLEKIPAKQVHNAFNSMKSNKSITELRGFVKFSDI